MIVGLGEVLTDAKKDNRAIAGLVCLGWEDMRAYVKAAELENQPIIIQAGPSCRRHTPLRVLGPMMRYLAEEASVPVVVHLDHGANIDECRQAIASGFSSVMYDGSRLPLNENIKATRAVVELAHEKGISVEGEIGFVGYAEGEVSATTDPEEAALFAKETGIDAMAISVGNVHLQLDSETELDEQVIQEIQSLTDTPLVIHGGSGVPVSQRAKLAASQIYVNTISVPNSDLYSVRSCADYWTRTLRFSTAYRYSLQSSHGLSKELDQFYGACQMVRLALLGAGRIGRVHARAISMVNDAHLKYVFDPAADASQLVVDAYGAISAPIEDILDDSEVDGVLICTPSDQHADQIKRAIKAGKAVFCEKPISTDLDMTRQVLEVVDEHQGCLMLGFQRRFDSHFMALKAKLAGRSCWLTGTAIDHQPGSSPPPYIPT